MLSPEQEDKKLVKQYKKTNKILRKQLQSLNEQIDALIIQKSNRIGLQKLPKVQKQITDTKVIHFEVQNLKKRLQHIKHDNDEYKKKIQVDWLQKYKELQQNLNDKVVSKETIMKRIKIYEKKLNQDKTEVNLRREEDKLLKEMQIENQQLARVKKIQRDLKNFINTQTVEDNKKTSMINELQNQQKKLMEKSQTIQPKKVIEEKTFPKGHLDDYEWEKLKKDFLELKESKQQQQMYLYEQNDRLRKDIKFLNQQIKVKRTRVDVVQKYSALEPQKKLSSRLQKIAQRNTIDATNVSESRRKRGFSSVQNMKNQSVRYRDRNNSISYD